MVATTWKVGRYGMDILSHGSMVGIEISMAINGIAGKVDKYTTFGGCYGQR